MTMSDAAKLSDGRSVIKRGLFRRLEERVKFAERPKAPLLPTVRRPAHVARMLALAHHIQWAIDDGRVADRAAVARGLGLTRARVTQLLDLLLLAPDLQDVMLHLEAVDGVEPMSERALRAVARVGWWTEQRQKWSMDLNGRQTALPARQNDRLMPLRPQRCPDLSEIRTARPDTWDGLSGV